MKQRLLLDICVSYFGDCDWLIFSHIFRVYDYANYINTSYMD